MTSTLPTLPPIRRIITEDDANGRSRIVEDAHATAIRTVDVRPNYRSVNIWRTLVSPAAIHAPDTAAEHKGILPPQNGTVLRIIDFPPEAADPVLRQKQIAATFNNGIFADAAHDTRAGAHPGMHRTETVDYAIILEGEIWAVMDDNETLMKTGDVLVQRGTNHAWANRSSKTARICFVLIDGSR